MQRIKTYVSHGRFPEARSPASLFALASSAASRSEAENSWKAFFITAWSRARVLGPIGICAPTRMPRFFRESMVFLHVQTGGWIDITNFLQYPGGKRYDELDPPSPSKGRYDILIYSVLVV